MTEAVPSNIERSWRALHNSINFTRVISSQTDDAASPRGQLRKPKIAFHVIVLGMAAGRGMLDFLLLKKGKTGQKRSTRQNG